MPVITVSLRAVVAFAAGLAIAVIGMFALRAWPADAAPGDSDTTFVPIAPCRLADTRPAPDRVGTHGAFGANDAETMSARGENGNCALPEEAVGLSLNVTAIGATAPTFLTFWPDGLRPAVSSLNPSPGQPPTPNAVTAKLSDDGTFNLYNLAGTVNVIIDVNGYFVSDSLAEVDQRLADVEDGTSLLFEALPFARSARTDVLSLGATSGAVVVSLNMTVPFDGQVIVNSSVSASTTVAGVGAACSIIKQTLGALPVADPQYSQQWQSAGATGSKGVLAGTRMFDIAAGATDTYSLFCYPFGPAGNAVELDDATVTATFTPAE